MRNRSRHTGLFAVSAIGLLAAVASAAKVDLIAAQGQIPPGGDGSAITSLNTPFTDANGKVGFTGVLASGERFVWYGSGVIWLNANGLPSVLTGTEATCGVSNTGNFIYSPTADGEDAVWTGNGLLLRATAPAPGIAGLFNSFNSRPNMLPDGTAVWIAGTSTTAGGASSGRVVYRCPDTSNPASTVPVIKSGDIVGAFTVGGTSNGLDFGYDFSDNTLHHIQVMFITGAGAAVDAFMYVDGASVAREGDPTGQGANWQVFTGVSINNSGSYVFGGDDSGAAATDAFIVHNGSFVVREGQTLDGYTLISGSAVRWLSINNIGKVAHIWESGSGASLAGALFVGNGANLATSSKKLLQIGEQVDLNGDNVLDATVTDFEASGVIAPGLCFSDHNYVYVEVSLINIGQTTPYEAILRVHKVCVGDANSNRVVDIDDLVVVITNWNATGGPGDVNNDGIVNIDDLVVVITAWGACP